MNACLSCARGRENRLGVWVSPCEISRRPLLCGPATHHIGFGRDQRNNRATHESDLAIGGEREYMNRTLAGTELSAEPGHPTPAIQLNCAHWTYCL
jgi:hypothetical protein